MSFTASDFSSVSRRQLLEWLNEEFELSATKVEQCGSGAIFVQIVDKLLWPYQFSGEVPAIPMQRVRWDTENLFDFADNYKLLQKVFQDYSIEKNIPVQQLSKGRMQDNLAFLQFLQNLFIKYYSPDDTYPGGWNRRKISIHGKHRPWAMARAVDDENDRPSHFQGAPVTEVFRGPPKGTTGTHRTHSAPIRPQPRMRAPVGGSSGVAHSNTITSTRPPVTTKVNSRLGGPVSQASMQQIEDLKARVAELEGILEDADVDINLLNEERAKYYVKLLSIEKLRLVREESKGGDVTSITPNEILACIDAVDLPEDIRPFESEFDYNLYVLGTEEGEA